MSDSAALNHDPSSIKGSSQDSGSRYLSLINGVMKRLSRPTTLLIALFALTTWAYLAITIPINDDEAVHYQPIFCLMYPFSNLSAFAERCESLELQIFGRWLPLRAYTYIGCSSAIFFFPIWWLFNDPLAIRIWTGILWVANGVLLSRILRIPWALSVTTIMLSTPVLAQHVVDTGPTSFQFLMIELVILSCLKALGSRGIFLACGLGILSGLLAFLAVEQKAFAVYGAPFAMYLLLAGYLRRVWTDRLINRIVRFICFSVGATAIFAPLTYTLFYSLAKYGGRYIDVMRNAARPLSFGQIEQWQKHFQDLVNRFAFMPGAYFHRNYNSVMVPDYPLNYTTAPFTVLVATGLICSIIFIFSRKWRELSLLLLAGLLSFIDLVLIARSDSSWAGHHIIFANIVIIVGVATALASLSRRLIPIMVPAICYILYVNLHPAWYISLTNPTDISDRSRDQILKIVNEDDFASRHLVLHISWGAYFIDSLIGPPSQAVAREKEITPAVRKLAADNHRLLAVVKLHQDGWEKTEEAVGLSLIAAPENGRWELWAER